MKPISISGKLYLIPTTLGEMNADDVMPQTIKRSIEFLDYYIVENEKSARKFIKQICPEKKQAELKIEVLNKNHEFNNYNELIIPLLNGINIGLMSEAGCPGVADPGAEIVKIAHQKNIQVIPLVGPSSILLAIMASGMNGQSFAFNGYLPIEKDQKKNSIKSLEKISFEKNQSQIFIETPYRNNKLFEDFITFLSPNTLLCIACDITLPTEFIKTKTVENWKKNKVDLHHRPCIFIVHKK